MNAKFAHFSSTDFTNFIQIFTSFSLTFRPQCLCLEFFYSNFSEICIKKFKWTIYFEYILWLNQQVTYIMNMNLYGFRKFFFSLKHSWVGIISRRIKYVTRNCLMMIFLPVMLNKFFPNSKFKRFNTTLPLPIKWTYIFLLNFHLKLSIKLIQKSSQSFFKFE